MNGFDNDMFVLSLSHDQEALVTIFDFDDFFFQFQVCNTSLSP